MKRYLCIHGHFYQPPRENPWLEVVERQESAHPYHDWNERITAECYGPNAVSRIINGSGKIAQIVNNYSWISFNIGPTLLQWMEERQPEVYQAILEADKASILRFGGHGSALAQAYNHIIMPLANRQDKVTQVRWGLKDFEHRFKRMPEGMWLAETAVDTETLEVLAEHGLRYTILAPHQAQRIRPLNGGNWKHVTADELDTTRPYRAHLPSGKTIDLFYYHGPVSRAVAFEKLLSRGERLAERMMDIYNNHSDQPQLAHIATDGETYGHHHAHGDMALAYAIDYIKTQQLAHITNYGEFLEKFPPTWEVEITENSSWSCAHGIGRWSEDCGCNSGGHAGWNQQWRKPLRQALDWLRDKSNALFESKGGQLLKDPWEARNQYISVILDRSKENVDQFLRNHQSHTLSHNEEVQALQLLEMQRHEQLMYTSCAWFFDEVSGIETVQVIQYAARTLQLAEILSQEQWEDEFLELLELAPSNLPEHKNARVIYDKWIRHSRVNLEKAAKHYAVLSLFSDEQIESTQHRLSGEHKIPLSLLQNSALSTHSSRQLPVYGFKTLRTERWDVGSERLLITEVSVQSTVTRVVNEFRVAVLQFGKYNVVGGVGERLPFDETNQMIADFKEAFLRADITALYRLFEHYFSNPTFDLPSLFRDQQREVISEVLEATMDDLDSFSQQLYQRNASLIRYLMSLNLDLPTDLLRTVRWVLQNEIKRTLDTKHFNRKQLKMLLHEAQLLSVPLDHAQLALGLQERVLTLALEWASNPHNQSTLNALSETAEWVRSLPFEVDLYRVQNLFDRLRKMLLVTYEERKNSSQPQDNQWSQNFATLNDILQFQSIQ